MLQTAHFASQVGYLRTIVSGLPLCVAPTLLSAYTIGASRAMVARWSSFGDLVLDILMIAAPVPPAGVLALVGTFSMGMAIGAVRDAFLTGVLALAGTPGHRALRVSSWIPVDSEVRLPWRRRRRQ